MIFPFRTLKSVQGLFMTQYDQRVIIRFLWKERIEANQITARLHAQFGQHVYKLRTVRFWISEVQFSRQDFHDKIRTGRRPLDDFDAKIVGILDKSPFESTCSVAKRLRVDSATVLEHFHMLIGFKSFHLRRVPHLLTEDFRQKRMETASAFLTFLSATERDGWHHLVTGGESWFFFDPLPSRMWTLSRGCREKTETANSEQRIYVHDYMESDRVQCCRQTSK
jgi:hypothetical protein